MSRRVPLVHITDLYHPPQDPDDQIDLATAVALEEFELRAVILDVTRRFLVAPPDGFDLPRDPGNVLVEQLAHLTGRPIPVASGPTEPLTSPHDSALDRPRKEQAGIALLLDILRSAEMPVTISIVGSARVMAAAYNREPELVRAATKVVLLNAGSTGTVEEWNVMLDPAAFAGLWQSDLPIHWYPCATEGGAFQPSHEHGTFWRASHADLFRDLPEPLRGWIAYGFSGSARSDIIPALQELGRGDVWENVLSGTRNMWSTAALVMAAGRALARTPDGWRFLNTVDASRFEVWPWGLENIVWTVTSDARIEWRRTETPSKRKLFFRRPDTGYAAAMTEALNALLRSLRL